MEAVGDTPLLRLSRLPAARGIGAQLLAKLEFLNPLGSVKDRVGCAMIAALEEQGALHPDSVIVEPTSGNTGLAPAFACAARGYRLILVMPEPVSPERGKLLALMGAEVVTTPAAHSMRSAVAHAEELTRRMPHAVIPHQFSNPANPAIHRCTTAEEIWNDTQGRIDVFVSAVGTGGTITGVAQAPKPRRPGLRVVAVEPAESPVLSGGTPHPHRIQGIGAGFVPQILDRSLIDEVVTVDTETSFETARALARHEGIPVGLSAGAAVAAAPQIGVRDGMAGKTVVVIPDFAGRYLSTALFDPPRD